MSRILANLVRVKDSIQSSEGLEKNVNELIGCFNGPNSVNLSELEQRVLNEIAPNLTHPCCLNLHFVLFNKIQHNTTKLSLVLINSLALMCERPDSPRLWENNKQNLPLLSISMKPFAIISDLSNSMQEDEHTTSIDLKTIWIKKLLIAEAKSFEKDHYQVKLIFDSLIALTENSKIRLFYLSNMFRELEKEIQTEFSFLFKKLNFSQQTVLNQLISDSSSLKLPTKLPTNSEILQDQPGAEGLPSIHVLQEEIFKNLNDEDLTIKLKGLSVLEKSLDSKENMKAFASNIENHFPTIEKLTTDINYFVSMNTLNIIGKIIPSTTKFIEKEMNRVTSMLTTKLESNKVSIREKSKEVLLKIFSECDKKALLDEIFKHANHDNWLVRDAVLQFTIDALKGIKINFLFDNEKLLTFLASMLDDPKAKVRARSMEALVVVSEVTDPQLSQETLSKLVTLSCFEEYRQRLGSKSLSSFNTINEEDKIQSQEIAPPNKGKPPLFKNKQQSLPLSESHTGLGSLDTDVALTSTLKNPPPDTLITKSEIERTSTTPARVKPKILKKFDKLSRKSVNDNETSPSITLKDDNLDMASRSTHETDFENTLKSNSKKPQLQPLNKSAISDSPSKIFQNSEFQFKYLDPAQLQPCTNPSSDLKQALVGVKNEDWSAAFEALSQMRRLFRHHSDVILNEVASIHTLLLEILKHVDSLRSSVSKNALLCLIEMIANLNKNLDSEVDTIITKLMKRSLDSNLFITEEVRKCFSSIGKYFPMQRLISGFSQHMNSKIPQVKINILQGLSTSIDVKKETSTELQTSDFERVLLLVCNFSGDAGNEVRNLARIIILKIHEAVSDKDSTFRILKENLGEAKAKKILLSMKQTPQHNSTLSVSNTPTTTPTQAHANMPVKSAIIRKGGSKEKSVITKEHQSLSALPQGSPMQEEEEKSGESLLKTATKKIVKNYNFNQNDSEDILAKLRAAENNDFQKRSDALEELLLLGEQRVAQLANSKFSLKYFDTLFNLMKDQNFKISNQAIQGFNERILSKIKSEMLPENILNLLIQTNAEGSGSNNISVRQNSELLMRGLLQCFDHNTFLPLLIKNYNICSLKAKMSILGCLSDNFESLKITKNNKRAIISLTQFILDEKKPDLKTAGQKLIKKFKESNGENFFSELPPGKKELIQYTLLKRRRSYASNISSRSSTYNAW